MQSLVLSSLVVQKPGPKKLSGLPTLCPELCGEHEIRPVSPISRSRSPILYDLILFFAIHIKHPASTGVIGHHTAGSTCFDKETCMRNLKNTQNYHMDSNGWSDIGYNYLIGQGNPKVSKIPKNVVLFFRWKNL